VKGNTTNCCFGDSARGQEKLLLGNIVVWNDVNKQLCLSLYKLLAVDKFIIMKMKLLMGWVRG
jgi:hypothetical protein